MNHAITVGGLIATLGIIGGVVVAGIGVVMFFAGSMSDAPVEGEAAGKQGCITFVVGTVAVVVGVVMLIQRVL